MSCTCRVRTNSFSYLFVSLCKVPSFSCFGSVRSIGAMKLITDIAWPLHLQSAASIVQCCMNSNTELIIAVDVVLESIPGGYSSSVFPKLGVQHRLPGSERVILRQSSVRGLGTMLHSVMP